MNRDYRDYPASIWDAIGDVDQGICCAALGGVVWDFVSHLTRRSSSPPWTAPRWRPAGHPGHPGGRHAGGPECVQRIDAILSAFYLKLGARSTAAEFESSRASASAGMNPTAHEMRPGLLSPGRQLAEKASQSSRPRAADCDILEKAVSLSREVSWTPWPK